MAGRHFNVAAGGYPKSRSPIFLFTVSILALSFFYFIFSSFSSTSNPTHTFPVTHSLNSKVDCSFVVSLEKFLTSSSVRQGSTSLRDDTVDRVSEEDVKKLDDSIWKTENRRLYEDTFYPSAASPLKVYVYEMPSKFTYDLLWLFRNTYKETSNLTSNGSPVHRLIEQHSIDYWLWADLIAPESERLLKNVVRVHKQEEADVFYIPFFTTISFFLLEKQQCKALYRVKLWSGWQSSLHGTVLKEEITFFLFITPGLSNLFADLWKKLSGCCLTWTQQGTGTSLDKFILRKTLYFLMYPM